MQTVKENLGHLIATFFWIINLLISILFIYPSGQNVFAKFFNIE